MTETINFVKSGRVGIVRLLHLDSCLAFKKTLVETGCFPDIHRLNQTIRSDPEETQVKVENAITKLLVPDLNFSTYLQVDQLQMGEVFGLESLAYPDDRVFSLVSEGCELLRVPLSSILELVGKTELREILKNICKPYPSDEELCKLFLDKNHWMFYRDKQVKSVVNQSILNRVHAPINSLKYQRGSNVHDLKKSMYRGCSLEGQIHKLSIDGTDDWQSGCVKMPWNEKSIKNLHKYMASIDLADAKGEYKALKKKILQKNHWWVNDHDELENNDPDLFDRDTKAGPNLTVGPILRKPKDPEMSSANLYEQRRRGQLDVKKKFVKERQVSGSNQNMLSVDQLFDNNVEDYDPRSRAMFLKKEVERIERHITTEEDHVNKRRGVGEKARQSNIDNDGRITRLIQGVSLPTFKLSSFQ